MRNDSASAGIGKSFRAPLCGPPITQVGFVESDFEVAERVAAKLGYKQTAYTSTSGLWGLFCLPENPRMPGRHEGGCIIKTREFGFMFVQDLEDLHLDEEGNRE